VSLDALTYFDWVMSTDFDLEACAFGEDGLDRRVFGRFRIWGGGTVFEGLRAGRCGES
jgi:hypothetical protein